MRRLSHKARKSVQRFDLQYGRVPEKQGQNRTGQSKSHKGVIFHLLGEKPHWTDFYWNLHSSCRRRRYHVCKVLDWNCKGLRFYRGSNFPIFLLFIAWA